MSNAVLLYIQMREESVVSLHPEKYISVGPIQFMYFEHGRCYDEDGMFVSKRDILLYLRGATSILYL